MDRMEKRKALKAMKQYKVLKMSSFLKEERRFKIRNTCLDIKIQKDHGHSFQG